MQDRLALTSTCICAWPLCLPQLSRKKPPDINCTDLLGNTPLHSAAYRGQKQCAQKLLRSGARPDIKNKNGREHLSLGFCWVRTGVFPQGAFFSGSILNTRSGDAAVIYPQWAPLLFIFLFFCMCNSHVVCHYYHWVTIPSNQAENRLCLSFCPHRGKLTFPSFFSLTPDHGEVCHDLKTPEKETVLKDSQNPAFSMTAKHPYCIFSNVFLTS